MQPCLATCQHCYLPILWIISVGFELFLAGIYFLTPFVVSLLLPEFRSAISVSLYRFHPTLRPPCPSIASRTNFSMWMLWSIGESTRQPITPGSENSSSSLILTFWSMHMFRESLLFSSPLLFFSVHSLFFSTYSTDSLFVIYEAYIDLQIYMMWVPLPRLQTSFRQHPQCSNYISCALFPSEVLKPWWSSPIKSFVSALDCILFVRILSTILDACV